jgi:hypothetical protein
VTNETLVNVGTEAKPVMMPMYLAVDQLRINAVQLAKDIQTISNQIKTK